MARGLTLIRLKKFIQWYKQNIKTNPMQRGFSFLFKNFVISKNWQSLAKFLKLTLEKPKFPIKKNKLSRKQQNLLK
jgi:hypothetical protein